MKSIILQFFTDLKNWFKILFKSNSNENENNLKNYIKNEIEQMEKDEEYIDILTLQRSNQLNFEFVNMNKDMDVLNLNLSKIFLLQNRIFNNNYIHYWIDFFSSDIWIEFKEKNKKYWSFWKKYKTIENAIFFDWVFELMHLKNELYSNTFIFNIIKKIKLIKQIILINNEIKNELLNLYIQNNNGDIDKEKNKIIVLFLFTLDFLLKIKWYNDLFLKLKNRNALSFQMFPTLIDYYWKNTINYLQSLIFFKLNYYNHYNILEYITFKYISEKNILNNIENNLEKI